MKLCVWIDCHSVVILPQSRDNGNRVIVTEFTNSPKVVPIQTDYRFILEHIFLFVNLNVVYGLLEEGKGCCV
jgi:hypothetical protein